MDETVNPSHTLRLADALIKQNKDFDMIMLPKSTHGFSDKEDKFFEQKMWRHFAKKLLGDYSSDNSADLKFYMNKTK